MVYRSSKLGRLMQQCGVGFSLRTETTSRGKFKMWDDQQSIRMQGKWGDVSLNWMATLSERKQSLGIGCGP